MNARSADADLMLYLRPFHAASHHGGNEKAVLEFQKINRYHVSLLPYFLEKLKATTDGDGNLLDQSLIIYGSPMADGNLHNHRRCPLIVLGHASGKLRGGLHVKAADATPMANAMLTLLHKLGHDDMTSFGDSSDRIASATPRSSESIPGYAAGVSTKTITGRANFSANFIARRAFR